MDNMSTPQLCTSTVWLVDFEIELTLSLSLPQILSCYVSTHNYTHRDHIICSLCACAYIIHITHKL